MEAIEGLVTKKRILILQHGFKRWDRFAFLLSLYGAIAFAMTTLAPTILDPFLHNPIYGTRVYPLSYWVVLVSIPVFVFLYRSNVIDRDILKFGGEGYLAPNRGVFSALSITVPMAILLVNFLPEFPHMWLFNYSITYAVIVAFGSFMHNYSPHYSFVANRSIYPEARIELVKSIYNSYYVALALVVTLGVGVFASQGSVQTYSNLNEQIMLSMASRVSLFYMLLGIFWGIASEVFVGMYKAQQKLLEIENISAQYEERRLQS